MPRSKLTKADQERGARIQRAYQSAGMKRATFAERLDRYYHDVIRLEKGQRPDPETLTRIAEICGVTERWLVRGTYAAEFEAWLRGPLRPADLRDVEEMFLGSINFPEPHPGPDWYSIALSAWRQGTRNAHVDSSVVRSAPAAPRPTVVKPRRV